MHTNARWLVVVLALALASPVLLVASPAPQADVPTSRATGDASAADAAQSAGDGAPGPGAQAALREATDTGVHLGGAAFEPRPDGSYHAMLTGGSLWTGDGRIAIAAAAADGAATELTFLSFSGAGAPVPENLLPGVTNRLVGDPSAWQTDLPRYAQVRYPDVAPGTDIVVYVTDDGRLEFDWLLAPGADPGVARFSVQGAEPRILPDGRLALGGSAVLEPPRAFQPTAASQGPSGADEELDAWFEADGQDVTVRVAPHDPARPLRIDPKIVWGTYHGMYPPHYAFENGAPPLLVPDSGGDVIVSGTTGTAGCAAPPCGMPNANAMHPAPLGTSYDAFMTRLDGATGAVEWSTFWGTSQADGIRDTAIYPDLSHWGVSGPGLAVVGYTSTYLYPTTPDAWIGVAPTANMVRNHGFLTIFTLDGQSYVYSTFVASSGIEQIHGVDVQGSRVAMAGYSQAPTTWPVTENAYQPQARFHAANTYEPIIVVLDPTRVPQQQAVYSTYFGSSDNDIAYDIEFDDAGDIYAVGYTTWDPLAAYIAMDTKGDNGKQPYMATTVHPTNSVARIIWAAKFDPDAPTSGASLRYATLIDGRSYDDAFRVDVDDGGVAYIVGQTDSYDLLPSAATAAFPHPTGTGADHYGFVLRLDPDGSSILSGAYYGRPGANNFGQGFSDVTLGAQDVVVSGSAIDPDHASYGPAYSTRTQPWQEVESFTPVVVSFSRDLQTRNYHFFAGGTGSSWAPATGGPAGGHTLSETGWPIVMYPTDSKDASMVGGYRTDAQFGDEDFVIYYTAKLPPVPVLRVTHESVPGLLVSKGTVSDRVHSFTGKADAWTGPQPTTYTEYVIDASLGNSLLGDIGDTASDYLWEWDVENDVPALGTIDPALLDFDDGVAPGTETYQAKSTAAGVKTYCLRLTDAEGDSSTACVRLPFKNRPPDAVLTVDPDQEDLPVCTPIRLDASGSSDLDSPEAPGIVRYDWDIDIADGIVEHPDGPDTLDVRFETPDTFTLALTVWDADGASTRVERLISISGEGVQAFDDGYEVLQGRTLVVDAIEGVLANDCALGSSSLEARLLDAVPSGAGTLSLATDGSLRFDAASQYEGTVLLEYEARDAGGNTDTAFLEIQVIPRNLPPTADDAQWVEATEDTTRSLVLTATDPEGGALEYALLDDTPGLAWTPPAPSYRGAADMCHADPDENLTFTYIVHDDGGRSDTGSVRIHVVCVNDAPRPVDDLFAVAMGSTADLDVLTGDSDPEDPEGILVTEAAPGDGSVAVVGTGTIRYVAPAAPVLDAFTYTVADPQGATATGTVQVWVFDPAANIPPQAPDVRIEAIQGTTTTFRFAATDDAPPSTLRYSAVADKGTITIDGDTASYTPPPPPSGCGAQDRFPYTVRDPGGAQDTAEIVVLVLCPNAAPTPVDDENFMQEDATGSLHVLANDSDPDGDALSITSVEGPGDVALDGDTVLFTPPPDETGTFHLVYTVSDGAATAQATVVVHVEPVPDAPRAVRDDITVSEDTPVAIDVLANDFHPDEGDPGAPGPIPLSLVTASAGTVVDGKVLYTPPLDASGTRTFTYTVSDGERTATGLVVVEILPQDDWPAAAGDVYQTTGPLSVEAPGVLGNDHDVDSPLRSSLVDPPGHGTLVLHPDGGFTYTPEPGFRGTDAFRYAAVDEAGASVATVTIQVRPQGPAHHPDPGPAAPPTQVETPPAAEEHVLRVTEGASATLAPPGDWVQADGPRVRLDGSTFTAPGVDAPTFLSFRLGDVELRVLVEDTNRPPVVEAFDQAVHVGDDVRLAVRATDPDGDALAFHWRALDAEAVELSSASAATPSFRPSAPGLLAFDVEVSDGLHRVVARTTVEVRTPPQFDVDFTAEPVAEGWWLSAVHHDDVRYVWTFPDGTRADGREVVRMLEGPGPHTVRLEATHAHGGTKVLERSLQTPAHAAEPENDVHKVDQEAAKGRSWSLWAATAAAASGMLLLATWRRLRHAPRKP